MEEKLKEIERSIPSSIWEELGREGFPLERAKDAASAGEILERLCPRLAALIWERAETGHHYLWVASTDADSPRHKARLCLMARAMLAAKICDPAIVKHYNMPIQWIRLIAQW